MQKIKKNLSAIQQKFQSLKQSHKLYEQPTPIGQVAQLMTYGVVSETQVQGYLKYVHSSQELQENLKINQNWVELNIQQMILFLDKVIKYRNFNKPKQAGKKQRLNLMSIQRKKKKKSTNDAHQNPYIPPKIGGTSNQNQNEHPIKQNQQDCNQAGSDSPYVSSQQEIQQKNTQCIQGLEQQNAGQNKAKSSKQVLDLPEDFKSLSVQERYFILLSKFQAIKSSLQKKFGSIYKHYRKQMYIPHQSFDKNSQLLMDLKIFLKYYRQFQIAKKYKTSSATQYFKKIALNGIWLDYQRFLEIHYELVEILSLNDKELNQKLQSNNETPNKKKSNQLKKQLARTSKLIIQNLEKLNDLSTLVSEQKMKKAFNENASKGIINKIVEVHSGLFNDDILLKLKQRIDDRKKRAAVLNNYKSAQRIQSASPDKSLSPNKNKQSGVLRSSPHKLTIYQQLQLPTLRPRQMKRSSIYSSLEILNMHKQKQKLKNLIRQEQDQKYLQAYFKKQKMFGQLMRGNSLILKRSQSLNEQSKSNFSLKSNPSVKVLNRSNIFMRNNLSLPRMKFT